MELGFSEIRVYRIPENWHGKMMIDHIKPPNFLGSWLNVSLNRIYSYLIIFILWSLGLITMILAESCYDWFPKNPMVDVVGHHFLMKSIDLHHWMWRGWLFKSAWDCSIEACRPKSGCPYDMDLLLLQLQSFSMATNTWVAAKAHHERWDFHTSKSFDCGSPGFGRIPILRQMSNCQGTSFALWAKS